MPPKPYDWYTFIAKERLNLIRHDASGIVFGFFLKWQVMQGQPFFLDFFVRNSWSCPVDVAFKFRVLSKRAFRGRKDYRELLFTRSLAMQMKAGEVSYLSVPGFATHVCGDCVLELCGVQVEKQGAGRRIFRRKDRTFNPHLDCLLAIVSPLGFAAMGGSLHPSVTIPVAPDPDAYAGPLDEGFLDSVERHSLWDLERPERLDLRPLYPQMEGRDKIAIEEAKRHCLFEYKRWKGKNRVDQELELLI